MREQLGTVTENEAVATTQCYYCKEEINVKALKCKHCGESARVDGVQRHSGAAWEYYYTWIKSNKESGNLSTAHRGYFTFEGRETAIRQQDFERVDADLQELGRQGWELVTAVPEWSWEIRTESGIDKVAYTYPSHVVAWYCIFKRPAGRIDFEVGARAARDSRPPAHFEPSPVVNHIADWMGEWTSRELNESLDEPIVVQVLISEGEYSIPWLLELAGRSCNVLELQIKDNPTVTIEASAENWLAIARGELGIVEGATIRGSEDHLAKFAKSLGLKP